MSIARMGWGQCIAFAVAGLALSGSAPKQQPESAGQNQTQTAPKPAARAQQGPTSGSQNPGCPGTRAPQLSCEAITAEATLRQVDLQAENNLLSVITALVAGLAAFFAATAARAASKSHDAFTEVERANLVVTLENYASSNVQVRFDIVAHNLGRSAALVISSGHSWRKTNKLEDFKGLLADIRTKIVPASGSTVIEEGIKIEPGKLKETPYIWVLIVTLSPLKGDIAQRFCFEVFDGPAGMRRACYTSEYSDEIKRGAKSPWWKLWG